ncbi:hypothetical protein [Parafrankia discariae]|uniref:hypothetical protein n=1 Tax=Parafrankia discariae TaxID=365528 RepID=UPI00039AC84D|nr:hypothetical protein [Parafrankia discariae]
MTSQPESIRRAHMDELVQLLASAEAQVIELTEQLAAAEKASAAADDILAGRGLDPAGLNLMIARRLLRILDVRTGELADAQTRASGLTRRVLDLETRIATNQAETAAALAVTGKLVEDLQTRISDLEDELVDAWHDGHRTSEPLHDVLGMTREQYATWVSDRPARAPTRNPQASGSEQVGGIIRASTDRQTPLIAAERGRDHCRPVTVPNAAGGDVTVIVRGSGELTEEGRQALGHVVRAVADRFAGDLADPPPMLRKVAGAFADAAAARGILLRQAAQDAGVTPAAVSRTLQGAADAVHLADLVRIATWAGLDIVAVPTPGWAVPDTTEQE